MEAGLRTSIKKMSVENRANIFKFKLTKEAAQSSEYNKLYQKMRHDKRFILVSKGIFMEKVSHVVLPTYFVFHHDNNFRSCEPIYGPYHTDKRLVEYGNYNNPFYNSIWFTDVDVKFILDFMSKLH